MQYYRPFTTDEHSAHVERIQRARLGEDFDSSAYDYSEQHTIFGVLQRAEMELVAPANTMHDYVHGTARIPDEIHTSIVGTTTLLSSEHATRSWHIDEATGAKSPKLSEPGTAALGRVVAAETGGTHIAMVGRQTGNANVETGHPYKRHIERLVRTGKYGAFVSIHGMQTGLVSDLEDVRPYDMLLGIGENPNASSIRAAAIISAIAERLGLRVATNRPFLDIVRKEGKFYQRVDSDGMPATNVFAAPCYTTRAAAQRTAEVIGLELPTLQIELAGAVRVLPKSVGRANPNPVGPYLAYEALRTALPLILDRTPNMPPSS